MFALAFVLLVVFNLSCLRSNTRKNPPLGHAGGQTPDRMALHAGAGGGCPSGKCVDGGSAGGVDGNALGRDHGAGDGRYSGPTQFPNVNPNSGGGYGPLEAGQKAMLNALIGVKAPVSPDLNSQDPEVCKLAHAHLDRMATSIGLKHSGYNMAEIIGRTTVSNLQNASHSCVRKWKHSPGHAAIMYRGYKRYCYLIRQTHQGSGQHYCIGLFR